MPSKSKKPWFRVKRYGYGVGLPIAWEGWSVLFVYLAATVSSAVLLPPLAIAAVVTTFTAVLVYLCYSRSDREWRWRSGG